MTTQASPDGKSLSYDFAPGWYIVGLTQLVDPHNPFHELLKREPDGTIGYSMRIYHVQPSDGDIAPIAAPLPCAVKTLQPLRRPESGSFAESVGAIDSGKWRSVVGVRRQGGGKRSSSSPATQCAPMLRIGNPREFKTDLFRLRQETPGLRLSDRPAI